MLGLKTSCTIYAGIFSVALVHFDDTVYLSNKPEASKESDCTAEDENEEDHNGAVAEVQHCANESGDSHLGLEIVHAVEHEVESS